MNLITMDMLKTQRVTLFLWRRALFQRYSVKPLKREKFKVLIKRFGDFLPAFNDGYAADLTVGDLSSMASGLDWNEKYDLSINGMMEAYITPDLDQLMNSRKIISHPGEGFVYLSGNTQLLGMVLEKALGQSISRSFEEHFWQPIGQKKQPYGKLIVKKMGWRKRIVVLLRMPKILLVWVNCIKTLVSGMGNNCSTQLL